MRDCEGASYKLVTTMRRKLMKVRAAALALGTIALLGGVCLAGKQFVMPEAHAAKSYPAHDEHPTEAVAVGLDPYDSPNKLEIFTVNYPQNGLLPIFVVVTNDGDQPVSLANMNAQLETGDRTKISPSTQEDVYRRLSRPSTSGKASPLPWPTKVKGAVSQKTKDEIERAQFAAKAVEPHSTQSGFMFFDVSDIAAPLAGAHFYLTGVNDAKGNELMYFEISLDKYLNSSGSH